MPIRGVGDLDVPYFDSPVPRIRIRNVQKGLEWGAVNDPSRSINWCLGRTPLFQFHTPLEGGCSPHPDRDGVCKEKSRILSPLAGLDAALPYLAGVDACPVSGKGDPESRKDFLPGAA